MSIDTVHTDKQRLEKLALFLEYCQTLGQELIDVEEPMHPGEVHALMRRARIEGENIIELAKESEACLKALVIANFIQTAELPEPLDDGMITIPRVLFDELNRDVQALKQLPDPNSGWDLTP